MTFLRRALFGAKDHSRRRPIGPKSRGSRSTERFQRRYSLEQLEQRTLLSIGGVASGAASETLPDCLLLPPDAEAELRDLMEASPPPLGSPPYGATAADTSEYMLGDISVTVVLLESNGAIDAQTENWTAGEIASVKTEIQEGLTWWENTLQSSFPGTSHDLSFHVDFTYADSPVSTGYEPINRTAGSSGDQQYWIDSFLNQVGYNSSSDYFTDVRTWDDAQRLAHNTHWAYTVFVVDSSNDANGMFADGRFAYAYLGGPFVVMTYDNDNWGIGNMGQVLAHETGHIFYAADEYPGSNPYDSYNDHSGYYNTQNLNAYDDNPNPGSRVNSIMAEQVFQDAAYAAHTSSPTSLQMLGWRDTDGDLIVDVLDVSLTLTGTGHYNSSLAQYEFSGSSSVQTLDNQNPHSPQHDITTNTVDLIQYRLDGGPWISGNTYGAYAPSVAQSVAVSSGTHTIDFRTIFVETALTSNIWSDTFVTNTPPTLTKFSDPVDVTPEDTQVEVTFADLAAKGNEADVDGTVVAFVVKSISTGDLRIGTSAATATPWAQNTNDTIDATHKAYWTPQLNTNGTLDAMAVVARDDGAPSLESTPSVTAKITVAAVNDPPTSADVLRTTKEDTDRVLAVADFPFSDVDSGDQLQSVKITQLPTAGKLYLDDDFDGIVDPGEEVAVNQEIAVAALNAGQLKFKPQPDAHGTSYDDLGFEVQDGQAYSDSHTMAVDVTPVADTPSVTNPTTLEDTPATIVVTRNPVDGSEVTYLRITNIVNGTLSYGGAPINDGDFIEYAHGAAGLQFLPAANLFSPSTTFSFQVQASTSADLSGLGGGLATSTITVTPVADTPSITPTTMPESTQSTDGLVVSRNTADGSEVTHLQITGIINGKLYKHDGTTEIPNYAFITYAEAHAGLKFTPALGLNSLADPFGFWVQASLNDDFAGSGIGGDKVAASITVTEVNDPPVGFDDFPAAMSEDETILFAAGTLLVNDSPGPANETFGPGEQTLRVWDVITTADTHGTLTVSRDGEGYVINVSYHPDQDYYGPASFDYVIEDNGTTNEIPDPKQDIGTVHLTIMAVNDAPVMHPEGDARLTTTNEDDINNPGNTVSEIIRSVLPLDMITDVDVIPLEGIAVVGTTGNGHWEYWIDDGNGWRDVAPVSNASALLLRSNESDGLRYVPDEKNGETASVTFRAWDQTSGTVGTKVSVSVNGGTTAFSVLTEIAQITVTDVNDAPVVHPEGNPVFNSITEDQLNNSGTTIAQMLASTPTDVITDVDHGAVEGIAVVGTSHTGGGTGWQFSVDGGATWTNVGSVDANQALLLRADDRLRFVPDARNGETAQVTFRAWDRTNSPPVAAGAKVVLGPGGLTSAYSVASVTETATLTVTPVNDAPVLDNSGNPTFTPITEDAITNNGNSVAQVIDSVSPLVMITDVDAGALEGIAVTGAGHTGGSDGHWEFSINAGASWTDVGTVSATAALVLRPEDRLRFVPDEDNAETGWITLVAWDQSNSPSVLPGSKVDSTPGGGTSAYSVSTVVEVATIAVTAINDAPVLTGASNFTPIDEDQTSNSGDTVAVLTTGWITDVDLGAVKGIAVTGLAATNGKWQYSIDAGNTWNDVGTVSATSALLLRTVDKLRFLPNAQNGSPALDSDKITFRAWDQTGATAGKQGTKVSPGPGGGTTPFSIASAESKITVTSVNDAPVIHPEGDAHLTAVTEDDINNPGNTVREIIDSVLPLDMITDVDVGAGDGIAVTGLTAVNGYWEYWLYDAPAPGWERVSPDVDPISDSRSLLLRPEDRLKFHPDEKNGNPEPDSDTIVFRAWDQTSGTAGGRANTNLDGGVTAFSIGTETARISVASVNDAPELHNQGSPIFTPIAEDDVNNPGNTVAQVIASVRPLDMITDVDVAALEGIAVTAVGHTGAGDGHWEFWIADKSTLWTDVGTVSPTAALVLRPEDLLRFVPDEDNAETGWITFVAWDQSDSPPVLPGDKVVSTPGGGTLAYSEDEETATITVTPVNDSPHLTTDVANPFTPINEDQITNSGDTVEALAAAFITDIDVGALKGIAVIDTDHTGGGHWEYSTDAGAQWTLVPDVDNLDGKRLLLRPEDKLRFVPDEKNGEIGSVEFRAWDQTGTVDTHDHTSPFSLETASSPITVSFVNDAPVIHPEGDAHLDAITEDDVDNQGNTVAEIIASVPHDMITDVDALPTPKDGIAVTALTAVNGYWEYWLYDDPTPGWERVSPDFNPISDSRSLLLRPEDRLKFRPDEKNGSPEIDSDTIVFRAWDQTSGTAGDRVDTNTNGGATAFSSNTEVATITVGSVNDAPVLDPSGDARFPTITEDDVDNPGSTVGDMINSVLPLDMITDVDVGAEEGIVITTAANIRGKWRYLLEGETTWADVVPGLLLGWNDRLRFKPNGMNGSENTIGFRAWDLTTGVRGDIVVPGPGGGTSAFSIESETASITVLPVNDPPDGTDNTVTILEDTTYTFTTADFGFTDPVDIPPNMFSRVKITTIPVPGSLTLNGAPVSTGQFVTVADIELGKLVFTPAPDGNGDPYASFTFQVEDNGGTALGGIDLDQSPNTMTVIVLSVNDEPAGADKTLTIAEDIIYPFDPDDFGFSDPHDNPPNSFIGTEIVTIPSRGTLKLNGTPVVPGQFVPAADIDAGKLRFSPIPNDFASPYAEFTFAVRDDGGTEHGGVNQDQTPNTITFNVTSVNDPPVASDDLPRVMEDESTSFSVDMLLVNDIAGPTNESRRPPDGEGQSLTLIRVEPTLNTHGTVTLNGEDIIYEPDEDYSGSATFMYVIEDDGTTNGSPDHKQAIGMVYITVVRVNDAPTAVDDNVTTPEDVPLDIAVGTLTTNDSEGSANESGQLLAVISVQSTANTHGTVTLSGGNISYEPEANYFGPASFTYVIEDNGMTDGYSDPKQATGTVYVTVTEVNDPPVAVDDSATTTQETPLTIPLATLMSNDSRGPANESGQTLTLLSVAATTDTHGTLALDGTNIVYTPDVDFSGAASFTYVVVDNGTTNGSPDAKQAVGTVHVTVVDDRSPMVTDMLVCGTAWSPSFPYHDGFSITAESGPDASALAWGNVDQIKVLFSEDVLVDKADLALFGINIPQYDVANSVFSYDAATFTAVWTLPGGSGLGADRLRVRLNADGASPIQDRAGNRLDGEWTTPNQAERSGDGVPGGNFQFYFNVLPGDANADGAVTATDVAIMAANWNRPSTTWRTGDFTGDGKTNGEDNSVLTGSRGVSLPPPAWLVGDADGNGIVNSADQAVLANHWGRSGMTWSDGDFNRDGIVNATDVAILAANWGATLEPVHEGTPSQPSEPVRTEIAGPVQIRPVIAPRRSVLTARRVDDAAPTLTAALLVEPPPRTTATEAAAAADAALSQEFGPLPPTSVRREQLAWSSVLARRQSPVRASKILSRPVSPVKPLAMDQ